jgi:endonuclease-8
LPEGDTLHRTARTLQAIVGKPIKRFASSRILSRDLAGKTITGVEARGKHLLIRLSDRRAIQAHFGMTGSVHVYRPGERWRRPEGMARFLIELDELVVVGFSIPTLRLIVAIDDTPREVAHLGPDVVADAFDANEAVRRLRERADVPIGVAIMDQTAVAGVGNIYKSETLFSVRVNPFAPVSALTDEQLHAIVERARRLMRSNLQSRTTRTTTQRTEGGQRYYVYKRSHRPCARCGTIVAMQRQAPRPGELSRSTYYCPKRQNVA